MPHFRHDRLRVEALMVCMLPDATAAFTVCSAACKLRVQSTFHQPSAETDAEASLGVLRLNTEHEVRATDLSQRVLINDVCMAFVQQPHVEPLLTQAPYRIEAAVESIPKRDNIACALLICAMKEVVATNLEGVVLT